MSVDRSDVEKAAHLARIGLSSTETDKHLQDLQQILSLIEQMQAIDTNNIEPLSSPLDAIQPMRKDQVTETDQRERFQSLAPATDKGHYLVPKVIE
ncbi:MAG: Asp-tRNA(Asn)/Glu-tRNA(Gln) amidotransferase subunit GatC [Immundisolibacteraceae bacterium]|nr:Asp-tRNA(Asn)/Glu-tRNA(Gln) amidotransferase subunit GatC [Immundisolibacteraceae bacterium]